MQHQKCNLGMSFVKHISNVPFKQKSDAYSLFSVSCNYWQIHVWGAPGGVWCSHKNSTILHWKAALLKDSFILFLKGDQTLHGRAGRATRDFDKVMKASKRFIFWSEQEFRLFRPAEEIFKYPLMLSGNNGGLGERSGTISVFVPYPGHFVAEQNPVCCAMQQLAEVQMPKAGPSFQSITELLPSLPELQTCRNMGRKITAERKQELGVKNYMQVIAKGFWQLFCWVAEVFQVPDNSYFQILTLSLSRSPQDLPVVRLCGCLQAHTCCLARLRPRKWKA